MEYSLFLTICLILSICVLVFAVAFCVCCYRRRYLYNPGKDQNKEFTFTILQIFILLFYISALVVIFPMIFLQNFVDEAPILHVFKSLVFSLGTTIQFFSVGADLTLASSVLSAHGILSETIGVIYSAYFTLVYLIAPILTLGFILSFFKNLTATIKYYLCHYRTIIYLSALNEKSLALAKDALDKYYPTKVLVVFCGVDANCSDLDKEKARRLGAVLLKKDINSIGLKKSRKLARKFYFIASNECDNLKSALELINNCLKVDNVNVKESEFYVFSANAGSEMLLDSADKGNMKVRRVNESRNFVYSLMDSYPIFDRYVQSEETKKLNVLICGFEKLGQELLKTLVWCGQMIGYELNVHVISQGENSIAVFQGLAPEILEMNAKRIKGEPYYNLTFYDGVDVSDSSFVETIQKVGEITTAYCCLGDDDLNIETAKKLSVFTKRCANNTGACLPLILSIVNSPAKAKTFIENGGLKDEQGEVIDIKFVGDTDSIAKIDFVEFTEFEKEAFECHMRWSNVTSAQSDVLKFEQTEYYRRASTAETLHMKLKSKLNIQEIATIEEIKELEHKRWSAFMRSEGFVYGAKKDFTAKTHPKLIPYDELSEFEKDKDAAVSKVK